MLYELQRQHRAPAYLRIEHRTNDQPILSIADLHDWHGEWNYPIATTIPR